MKERLLSTILAVTICLALLPATALAAEPDSAAQLTAVQNVTAASGPNEIALNKSDDAPILYIRQNENNTLVYQIQHDTAVTVLSNNYKVRAAEPGASVRLKIQNNSSSPMTLNLHIVDLTSIGGISSEGTGTGAVTVNLSVEGNCQFKTSNFGNDIEASEYAVFWRSNEAAFTVNLSAATGSTFVIESNNYKLFYDPAKVKVNMTPGTEVYATGSNILTPHITDQFPSHGDLYTSCKTSYFGEVTPLDGGKHKTTADVVTECVAGEPIYAYKDENHHEKSIACQYCKNPMNTVQEAHDKNGNVEPNEDGTTHTFYCKACGGIAATGACVEKLDHDKQYHWKVCETCGRVMSEKTAHELTLEENSIQAGAPYKTGTLACSCGYKVTNIPIAPEGKTLIAMTAGSESAEELLVTVDGVKHVLHMEPTGSEPAYAAYLEADSTAKIAVEIRQRTYSDDSVRVSITGSNQLIQLSQPEKWKTGKLVYSNIKEEERADYKALDAQLARVPADQSAYPAVDVLKLQLLIDSLPSRYVPNTQQALVDQAAADLKTALDALKEGETPVPADAKEIILTAPQVLTITASGYRVDGAAETAWTGAYRLKGEGTSVVVESGIHTIVMDGVKLLNGDGNPFDIRPGAAVDLVLNQGTENQAGHSSAPAENCSGIHVPYGSSLCIRSSNSNTEDGTLLAAGGKYAAGIGSNNNGSTGNISIRSGNVTAQSQGFGAGIGGGSNVGSGTIKIYGGRVVGTCLSNLGSGIGVGSNGYSGSIEIYGGTIAAKGSYGGAGIGGAGFGAPDAITITGGQIEALSYSGAGIGGGDDSGDYMDTAITITGGRLTVTSQYAAGIGGGTREKCGPISIKNAVIVVNGSAVVDIGTNYIYPSDEAEAINRQIHLDNVTIFGADPAAPNVYPTPTTHAGEAVEYRTLDKTGTPDGALTLKIDGEKVNSYVKDGKVVIAVKAGADIVQPKPTHTLTWELAGGTASGEYTQAGAVVVGDQITAPTLTREGYDFKGWVPTLPETMPNTDVTYTAQWEKKPEPPAPNPGGGSSGGGSSSRPDPKPEPPKPPVAPEAPNLDHVKPGETITETKPDGTKVEASKGEDGSTTVTETKKDGTVIEAVESANGDKTVTEMKPDGSSVTSEEKANGDKAITETKKDGSSVKTEEKANGDKAVTETKKDGSSVKMENKANGDKIITNIAANGSSVSEGKKPDGTTAVVTTDTQGKTTAEVSLSKKAVKEAAAADKPVELPVPPVKATGSSAAAPEVKIETGAQKPVEVVIPVESTTPGTVAVTTRADGTEVVVRKSISNDIGVVLEVEDGASVKIVDNTREFNDVPETHWAKDVITAVTSRQIYNGTGADTFSPDAGMSRGMLAVVLHNLENNPEGDASGFDDVDNSKWYAEAVGWAAGKGIVNGYGDTFAPEATITREQLAVMLWRYSGSPAAEDGVLDFSDANSVSDWALEAMCWAVREGIINGMDGALNPQGTATRAQVAAMVMRMLSK